jgi:hypothetical protein
MWTSVRSSIVTTLPPAGRKPRPARRGDTGSVRCGGAVKTRSARFVLSCSTRRRPLRWRHRPQRYAHQQHQRQHARDRARCGFDLRAPTAVTPRPSGIRHVAAPERRSGAGYDPAPRPPWPASAASWRVFGSRLGAPNFALNSVSSIRATNASASTNSPSRARIFSDPAGKTSFGNVDPHGVDPAVGRANGRHELSAKKFGAPTAAANAPGCS